MTLAFFLEEIYAHSDCLCVFISFSLLYIFHRKCCDRTVVASSSSVDSGAHPSLLQFGTVEHPMCLAGTHTMSEGTSPHDFFEPTTTTTMATMEKKKQQKLAHPLPFEFVLLPFCFSARFFPARPSHSNRLIEGVSGGRTQTPV